MDHDWAPIAPPEDDGLMCNVCFQCKCCSDWTDECSGGWVPSEKDFNTRLRLDTGTFQDLGDGFYRVSGAKRSAITNRYLGEQK